MWMSHAGSYPSAIFIQPLPSITDNQPPSFVLVYLFSLYTTFVILYLVYRWTSTPEKSQYKDGWSGDGWEEKKK